MRGVLKTLAVVFGIPVVCSSAHAERRPVLGQIDLEKAVTTREQYLPQLTSGPSGLTWSADSREVIYSMEGSLWRQATDSGTTFQLTDGPGYDYQPDWSPDGHWVIFSSYRNGALELWRLDLLNGTTTQLTQTGAVNVEPRFSPDGHYVAWVSTTYHRRFHIFVARIGAAGLTDTVRVTGETRSPVPRQYSSSYDIEISPVWTRDGRSLVFVSNRNHSYGSGGLWSIATRKGVVARELHYEETNWRVRPDVSPDGKRVVFSSYEGREWLQLWLLPASGHNPLPISYGDWDEVGPRWSPDGREIAFVSNRAGNTHIWIQSVLAGEQRALNVTERRYLGDRGRIDLTLRDERGQPMPARVSITDARGKFHAPDDAWIQADDGYDPARRPYEAHYFHSNGHDLIEVPAGVVTLDIVRGIQHPVDSRTIRVNAGSTVRIDSVAGQAVDLDLPGCWISADLHVHMNYGGNYRTSPERLLEQAAAEDVALVHALIVNREVRIPDVAFRGRGLDPHSTAAHSLWFGQEFHTNFWGHLGMLGGTAGMMLPGYTGYPDTAVASLSPTNADIADVAHARGSLVGYVHPFQQEPDPNGPGPFKELPVDVALGKMDYLEVLGYSDHRSTAAVWYRLLNLGFRIPAGAGTDFMANYAAPHGPVGLNRVYARVDGYGPGPQAWLAALAAGRTFATNGPMLRFTLGGHEPGDEVNLGAQPGVLPFTAQVRSIVPVDRLELVCDGRVLRSMEMTGDRTRGDWNGSLAPAGSGWCLLRASSDHDEFPILADYLYATTSPVYMRVADCKPSSPADASYFQAWVERLIEVAAAHSGWNSAAEKRAVMHELETAREVYVKLQERTPACH